MIVSKDNSCTTNNACPTYEFMLLNVARLLLNMSRDKSKIKFIGDLCSNQTLFAALCETFLSDAVCANGMTDLLDKCPVKETFLPDISRFYRTLSQSFSVDKRLIHARCKIIQKN